MPYGAVLQQFSHLSLTFCSIAINNNGSLYFKVVKKVSFFYTKFLFLLPPFTPRRAGEALIRQMQGNRLLLSGGTDGLEVTRAVSTAVWEGRLMQGLGLT